MESALGAKTTDLPESGARVSDVAQVALASTRDVTLALSYPVVNFLEPRCKIADVSFSILELGALRLKAQGVDFDLHQALVSDGNGKVERISVLP